jgi:hypothetical protein
VHELGRGLQLGLAFELALDPVLDGLDVVVGGALDGLDGGAVGCGKIAQQAQQVARAAGDSGLNCSKPASDRAMNQVSSTCTR